MQRIALEFQETPKLLFTQSLGKYLLPPYIVHTIPHGNSGQVQAQATWGEACHLYKIDSLISYPTCFPVWPLAMGVLVSVKLFHCLAHLCDLFFV